MAREGEPGSESVRNVQDGGVETVFLREHHPARGGREATSAKTIHRGGFEAGVLENLGTSPERPPRNPSKG